MLANYCGQNDSYEVTKSDYQAKSIEFEFNICFSAIINFPGRFITEGAMIIKLSA